MIQGRRTDRKLYFGEEDDYDFTEFEDLCEQQSKAAEEAPSKCSVVPISPEKYHSLFQPWKGALLLKLLGKSVSLRVLEQRTRDLWQLEWGCQMIDMENDYFLARFYKREDYFYVLEGGPWIVMGHYLTVAKWKPNFRSSDGNMQTTLVWVRFPDLPIELFDEEVLYAICNVVGCTTHVDDTTLQVRRERYARVCVEADLAKPLVPFVSVLGRLQRVEYEGLHMICFDCGKYGHRADNCSLHKAAQNPMVVEPQQGVGTFAADGDSGFGPWMLPKYGKRRPHKSTGGRRQP